MRRAERWLAIAGTKKAPVAEKRVGAAASYGHEAGPRAPGLRTEEEARQISNELAKAHKAAIDSVARRNENAHQQAKERRVVSERLMTRLRSEAQAARTKAVGR